MEMGKIEKTNLNKILFEILFKCDFNISIFILKIELELG